MNERNFSTRKSMDLRKNRPLWRRNWKSLRFLKKNQSHQLCNSLLTRKIRLVKRPRKSSNRRRLRLEPKRRKKTV